MTRLTAVVIDTYEEREILKIALNMTAQCAVVKDIVLLSDRPIQGYSFSPIEKVHSTKTYNQLMLNIIPEKYSDEHLMIFQWDGFALNSNNWSDDFLKYDYIGAPHHSQIYNKLLFNGGFSLRSPSLNQLIHEKLFFSEHDELSNEPEDVIICNLLGKNSNAETFKLPSYELARRFSFEHGEINSPFFGFHGVFNFPHLFSEDILINFVTEFKERLNQPHILLHFLKNCVEKNYFKLLQILFEHRNNWSALSICISNIDQNPELVKLKVSLNLDSSSHQINNSVKPHIIDIDNLLAPVAQVKKLEITDGELKISNISIIILVRNNAAYLTKLFQMLKNLETTYDCVFDYFFLENGSLDNSIALIRDFLKFRSGSITSLGNTEAIDQMPRTVKMAFLRNYAKNVLISDSSWTLLIDTDIYFGNEILSKLFEHSPGSRNIGMLCSYGLEIRPSLKQKEWECQNHYYDTFALSIEKKLYWPHCVFSDCIKCANISNDKISPSGLITTDSAFGGLALIPTDLLINPGIVWSAIKYDETWLCEHIGFCQTLRNLSKKSIAIASDCIVYWDASTFGK